MANVLSDVSGLTLRQSFKAIPGGERDSHKMAAFRNPRVKTYRGNPLFPARSSHDGSSRNGSYRLSSIGQQRQPLFAIHGLPGNKLLGKHIHPAKKSQFDEKLQKI
jgi:hypothetical protein